MKKTRIGLIGASRIASKVAPMAKTMGNLELVGVAAQDHGRAKAFAQTHQLPRAYESYAALLGDAAIDAVYISTLSSSHTTNVEAALLAGKHVLCEKPLVLNADEAKKLYALAQSRGLNLLEGLMYHFHPQIARLHQIIASGQIGEITFARADFCFDLYDLTAIPRPIRATAAAGGGALNDLGCYLIDFISGLCPENVSLLSASAESRRDAEVDLETRGSLAFSNGFRAQFRCAMDGPSTNLWEVSGTKGSVAALRWDPQGNEPTPLYVIDENSQGTLIHCKQGNQFGEEFAHFARVVQGLEPPHIPPARSIRNAEVMDAIRATSKARARL